MNDDFLPLSSLQHYLFCPRQCALIYLEQVWSENLFTAEGRVMHDKTYQNLIESRGDVRTAFGVRLISQKLGLTGQADVVEFHRVAETTNRNGEVVAIQLPGVTGIWSPFPVEYKRGKPKSHQADKVQLCAQAICLEEMLNVLIPKGALFYGRTRHRYEVDFTDKLRSLTEETALKIHLLIKSGKTPPPRYDKAKCDLCSLIDICRPLTSGLQRVDRYINHIISLDNEETP